MHIMDFKNFLVYCATQTSIPELNEYKTLLEEEIAKRYAKNLDVEQLELQHSTLLIFILMQDVGYRDGVRDGRDEGYRDAIDKINKEEEDYAYGYDERTDC